MESGIFLKTYKQYDLDEALKSAKQDGAKHVNFNIGFIKDIDIYSQDSSVNLLSAALKAQQLGLQICSLSATYNLIHPDENQRMRNVQAVINSIKAASTIDAKTVSLCTGTRNKESQWRFHPDNSSQGAWEDLLHSLELIIPMAEQYKIQLGIEPELNNVISSAQKARELIDKDLSPMIGIIMDAANLIGKQDLNNQHGIIEKAFDLLGENIILAHAKDIQDKEPIEYCAAGKGILDFHDYINQLHKIKYNGPIVLHGLEPSEAKDSMKLIQNLINY